MRMAYEDPFWLAGILIRGSPEHRQTHEAHRVSVRELTKLLPLGVSIPTLC